MMPYLPSLGNSSQNSPRGKARILRVSHQATCHALRILGPSNGRVWTFFCRGVLVFKIARTFEGSMILRVCFHKRQCKWMNKKNKWTTVDGWNPAPVDMVNIPLFIGFHTSQVVQDFSHQQYESSQQENQPSTSNISSSKRTNLFQASCLTHNAQWILSS